MRRTQSCVNYSRILTLKSVDWFSY